MMLPARLPTPSKLGLSYFCGAPFTVDTVWQKDEPHAGARFGSCVGKAMELWALGEPHSIDNLVVEFDVAERIGDAKMAFSDLKHELSKEDFQCVDPEYALALNYVTWETRKVKEYWDAEPLEKVVIPDVVLLMSDGSYKVIDYKMKRKPDVWPGDGPQVDMYTIAIADHFDSHCISSELWYWSKRGVAKEKRSFDAFDIEALKLDNTVHLVQLVSKTERVPGDWCHGSYCGVRTTCPVAAPEKKRKR